MPYSTADLKKGLNILLDGEPYKVIEFQHVKPGKGSSFTRTTLKNLLNGKEIEKTFKSGEKFESADVEVKDVQFLFPEEDKHVFMDSESSEQYSIPVEVVGENKDFLKEGTSCQVTFWNGQPISITLPSVVELKVTHTEPAVRGETSSPHTKQATVETGAVFNVPLFINEGEMIQVNTESREFVPRTK